MSSTSKPTHVHAPSSVIIESVSPVIDCGRYPVKREVGDVLVVEADIFKDGHDKIAARLLYRTIADGNWHETEMKLFDNDRWRGSFGLMENTRYLFSIEAFPDRYATWKDEITKKIGAGFDISLELQEGRILFERVGAGAGDDAPQFAQLIERADKEADQTLKTNAFLSPSAEDLMAKHRDRTGSIRYQPDLEVTVDRVKARYSAWYELFPRSSGTVPNRSGTFSDVIDRLPAIAAMGFDTVYFPPIHPIGRTNRKGPNNTLHPLPDSPGVPYAIGNETGGHDAIEPELGNVEDFARLVSASRDHGIEIALDLAINASPDHPWAHEHSDWFHIRPDGTIRFSENPPKKYEDIYPVNFESDDWQALWDEVKRIVLLWVERGVKTFRVDNPHTKPTVFWEWLISEVQRDHPDTIFLSEAFTRPKVMKSLAKSGFTQSYSYFTWRHTKAELTEYFTELTQTDVAEYMRANLFTNTHDILPTMLQTSGRPGFQLRLVLAATLSSVYGIYSGFELCEATPVPGREEYLNSEKYDYKVWDWDRPDNIIEDVTRINRIRGSHPALQEYDNLRFYPCDNPNMLCYGKRTSDNSDIIVVVANLDPHNAQETLFHLPLADFGMADDQPFEVDELIAGASFTWTGGTHHLSLEPAWNMALVYSIRQQNQVPPDDAAR